MNEYEWVCTEGHIKEMKGYEGVCMKSHYEKWNDVKFFFFLIIDFFFKEKYKINT